jgi:hypothetical protein
MDRKGSAEAGITQEFILHQLNTCIYADELCCEFSSQQQ